jgi:hypothetical protein
MGQLYALEIHFQRQPCGPQKFRLPLRAGNSESGHEKVSLLLEVSEVVIG